MYLDSKLEDKRFCTEYLLHFCCISALYFFQNRILICYVRSQILDTFTFPKEFFFQSSYCDFVLHSDLETLPRTQVNSVYFYPILLTSNH